MTEQLALIPEPARRAQARPTLYWENHGPRQWREVTVTTRYGPCGGAPEPQFPLVRTGRLGPRNVTILRADGTSDVVPVRNLRRNQPAARHGQPHPNQQPRKDRSR